MIINKRIDHATADIVDTGVGMQRAGEDDSALSYLRQLGVGEEVILRTLDPAGVRREPRRPRPATLVLLRPPGLRLVT